MKKIIYSLILVLAALYNVNAQSVPAEPIALAATVITSSGFTANWNSAATATGYYIDVATDNAFTNFVPDYQNINIGNVLSYRVNSFLTAGTTYYYRVRAYNANGTSDNSNTINLITIPSVLTDPTSQNGIIIIEDETTITFAVIATGASDYQWRKNGVVLTDTGNISGAINNALTLTNISNISEAYFGSYDCVVSISKGSVTSNPVDMISSPMSVELISFEVQAAYGTAHITWSTASETNNDYYTVERSENGTDYTNIGIVSGVGNSNEKLNYSFDDFTNPVESSFVYYKLKQTDFDGKTVTIGSAVCSNDNSGMFNEKPIIYVTSGNTVQVSIASDKNLFVQIVICDISGRMIISDNVEILKGNNTFSINTDDLNAGVYIIALALGVKVCSEKINIY